MSTWFWYVARPHELMIDLDRCPPNKLTSVGHRLLGAHECHALAVDKVYLYPSPRNWHYHLIITLEKDLTDVERITWELYLRSDPFRTANNLARATRGCGAVDLLITTAPWEGFYRPHDHTCRCGDKHSRTVMATCPIARKLRGKDAARVEFGFPSAEPLKWHFGRVELPPAPQRGGESMGFEDREEVED